MSPAHQLLGSLAALRRQWKQRLLLEGAAWIVVATIPAVLVAYALGRAFAGNDDVVVIMRIGGYALLFAALVRFLVIPLVRRTSDVHFAMYVEEHAPELRQALISSVQELGASDAARTSPALTARLVERTATMLRPISEQRRIERPRMRRATRGLVAAAVVALAVLFGGPDGVRQAARALFVPWTTAQAAIPAAVRVVPGDVAVPRGASVDVGASLVGFAAGEAQLVFRSDTLGEWIRLPMTPDELQGSFTARLFDLTQPTEYFVESDGIRSPLHRLTISDLPAVSAIALDLRFPAYTGMQPERIEEGGDVAAIVGTTVTVHPTVTKAVKGGTIAFDDGTTVPLTVAEDGTVSGSFRVRKNAFYRIDLVAEDGTAVAGGVQYVVEALPDRKPTVAIDEPGRDTKVTNIEEVTIAARASDDHGVQRLELRYQVNGGAEQRVVLADGARQAKEPRAAHTLFLEEMQLAPGDLVSYHAWARDAVGNEASSDIYFLEVRPYGKNYRQAEQQGGGGGGGGGEGGESPDGFVPRQREVIAGTFNWLRDSATADARTRREDIATLNIAEGRLREDVANVARRMVERGTIRMDTTFRQIVEELNAAVRALQAAEEQLVRGRGREALGPEQQALQRLQRAEALYRDVQVQMGGQQQGGGGGGGGGQQRPEDLADLFELERDKLRNQYEAVQQQASSNPQQQARREADAALQRLKELAQRQQQENERMQRLAEAMRERLGQQSSGGGGGGASQRELARQAEEEARRLERLAREQNSQELAQAAQQLQQAADAMRRAAAGQQTQGNAASEQLDRAARQIENTRAARTADDVRQLAEHAENLEERQQEIAAGVRAMQGTTGAQRQQRMSELAGQKDALAREVEQLETNAERVARDARREQPRAAQQAAQGAEAIRDQRIRDKIEFSKNVIRGGSSDYANALEEQIADNLREVAEEMRRAERALGNPSTSARGQERTLERTRELVRSLESLRDRVEDRNRAAGAQGSERGEQAARGQEEGRGQPQGRSQEQARGEQQARGQAQGQQQGQQGQGQGRAQGQQGGRDGRQGETGQGGDGRDQGVREDGERGGQPTRSVGGGDARQFSRELGLRRAAAEELRGELARQGVDVRELDEIIRALRRLESDRRIGDPKGLADLEGEVIEGLKDFEYSLYRRLGLIDPKGPAQGTRAPIPPEYRAAVEEYYRSLAGARKP